MTKNKNCPKLNPVNYSKSLFK